MKIAHQSIAFAALLVGFQVVSSPRILAAPLQSPASTSLPAPTRIAKAPLAPVAATNSSFEAPSLGAATWKYFNQLTAAQQTSLAWTMTGLSGVSSNGSGLTSSNPNTPFGGQVAFLAPNATMRINHSFTAGTYRVRYWVAPRVYSSVASPQIRIRVNNVDVELQTLSTLPNYAEYTSRTFEIAATGSFPVELAATATSRDLLIDSISFEPMRRWSDVASWFDGSGVTTASSVPSSADNVQIPTGRSIAINNTLPRAGTINVNGELEVSNANAALETRALMVMGSGSVFRVGASNVPFMESFTLTLRGGNASAENVMGGGTNVLMAMGGGKIILQGSKQLSWTQLAAPAAAGATQLTLSQPVGWRANDRVVIAPSKVTTTLADATQIEERQITNVSPDGRVLTITPGLTYAHLGSVITYPNAPVNVPASVDERAEVGLLTHNVKIQGDGSSTGGHVMVMFDGARSAGIAKISNVEFYKMGQKQRLGRYPFHWHMIEAAGSGQYITDSSIRNSFNRVVSIHGTDNALVQGLVAYDHIGHGIILEDGGEQNNAILGNLVLGTKAPAAGEEVLPTDNSGTQLQNRSPAAFWITNPSNRIEGNVAAGTVGTGFWFALPNKPTGPSAGTPYFMNRTPNLNALGTFINNVAHSTNNGFDVNDGINADLTLAPNVPWVPPFVASFRNERYYANSIAIYHGSAGAVQDVLSHEASVLADNNVHVRVADSGKTTNALIVSDTGLGALSNGGNRIAYWQYDGPGRLQDSRLIGFDHGSGVSLLTADVAASTHTGHLFRGLTYADRFGNVLGPVAGQPTIKISSMVDFVSFPDTKQLISCHLPATGHPPTSGADWGMVIRDVDGSTTKRSATAVPNLSLVTNHSMVHTASDWAWPNIDGTPSNVVVSDKKFAHLLINFLGATQVPVATDCIGRALYNVPEVIIKREGDGLSPMFDDKEMSTPFDQLPVIVRGTGAPFNAQPVMTYVFDYQGVNPIPLKATLATQMQLTFENLDPGDISPILKFRGGGFPVAAVSITLFHGTTSPVPLSCSTLSAVTVGTPTTSACYRGTDGYFYLRLVNQSAKWIQANFTW